jgi:plastocyanin
MRLGVGLVCAFALGAAACASSSRAPVEHRVAIQGMQFVPADVRASAGDTIVWVNEDLVPHTATAAGAFDSGVIASRGEWRLVVKERGVVAYGCTLHPTMKATLTVR